MDVVTMMEQQLMVKKVISFEPTPQLDLLALEQDLLQLAACPDLCGGIVYFLPVKTDDDIYLVR
jgi:hypothetical protein